MSPISSLHSGLQPLSTLASRLRVRACTTRSSVRAVSHFVLLAGTRLVYSTTPRP